MDLILATAALFLGLMMFGMVNANWRSGAFFILGVGFLQDVFRKLVPGEPVAITATVAVVMLFVWGVGLHRFGGYREEMSLSRHYPPLVKALIVFCGLVLFQSVVTIVNFDSLPLAGIGLIAYLSPLPAIWVGWWFCRTENDTRQWLQFYVVSGIVVAFGVYLSWMDMDWTILKQVGEGIVLYDPYFSVVATHSGFMRASEIAAWHLGAAVCLSMLLATIRPNPARVVTFALAIFLMVPAILFTGRRKTLAMIGLFAGLFIVLLQFSRNRDARKASIAIVGLALGALSTLYYLTEDASETSTFRPYAERGESVFVDAWDRFYELGLGSIVAAVELVGFFGLGAGVVSQGGQYYGVNQALVGSAEGGVGKVIVELGIPGLLVSAWITRVIVMLIRKLFSLAHGATGEVHTLVVGLVAFLLVNVILFITASQVFGDPFVLIILGIVFGVVLATSRILVAQRNSAVRSSLPTRIVGGVGQTRYRAGRY